MKYSSHLPVRLLPMLALLMPLFGYAQQNISKIPIVVKNRVVIYSDTCRFAKGSSKAKQFDRAGNWLEKSFHGNDLGVEKRIKTTGMIKGRGIFKVITSDGGHYYWLKFNIVISVTDSTCILNTLNYYEKPVEPGISNEYSKIEYRWNDFKRGKPWSAEDERLFLGLDADSRTLLASFHQEMIR